MKQQSSSQFDIVIIGAGAVGSALAIELAALDYRIAIVDAAEPFYGSSDPERVIALSYGSRCYLEDLGAWQGVADGGAGLIRHIHVSEPGNEGSVEMDAADAGVLVPAGRPAVDALGYVVEMGTVLKPLHERFGESVSLFAPASISKLHLGHGVESNRVTINDGNGEHTLSAPLVIGTDGTYSQIRLQAGIGTRGWDYNRFGLVFSASIEGSHDDVAYECFRQQGPLAFLPMADGRYSVVWALAPLDAMRLLHMPDALFIKKLERSAGKDVIGRFGPVTGIGKRFCFPLELTVAETYARPGLALAGNAAHTIHPVAGQGMNLGFRDAAVLAEVLASDVARNNPGALIVMQAYAEKRRADVLAVAGFTESMLHSFGFGLPLAKETRSQGMRTLQKMPSLRSALLGHAAGIAQMGWMKMPRELIGGEK